MLKALLSLPLLVAPLLSQTHPCFTNLVPNGDFLSIQVDRWVVAGQQVAANWVTFTTDGINPSLCYKLAPVSGNFTLTQPTTFNLTAASAYEFSFDVHRQAVSNSPAVNVGITDSNGRITLVSTYVDPLVSRIATTFTAPRTGAFTIDLQFGQPNYPYWNGMLIHVDNVVVRPLRDVVFGVPGTRSAGTTVPFAVKGLPNAVFALFLTNVGFAGPLSIGSCQGQWLLGLPAYAVVSYGLLDSVGAFSSAIAVPPSVAGVPLYWQAAIGPSPCSLGCPVMIGFP